MCGQKKADVCDASAAYKPHTCTIQCLLSLYHARRLPCFLQHRYCKTKYGYGAFVDVTKPTSGMEDKQESYFLAETLKCVLFVFSVLVPVLWVKSTNSFVCDRP